MELTTTDQQEGLPHWFCKHLYTIYILLYIYIQVCALNYYIFNAKPAGSGLDKLAVPAQPLKLLKNLLARSKYCCKSMCTQAVHT